LRPAWEDWVGAGAILEQLAKLTLPIDQFSPEAQLAMTAFQSVRPKLAAQLRQCVSGQELLERGFAQDIELAAEWQVSANAPRLLEQTFFTSNHPPEFHDQSANHSRRP
jgi:2-phosphosulfolactate phosphatase